MKKLFLLACLCAGGATLHAQETEKTEWRRGTKDPLYLQVYAGANKSANENLPWTEMTRYPLSGGAFVALGREFAPLWGWRAAFRYDHNKSRNVQPCESKDVWGWDNLGLFADITLDLDDIFRPRREHRQDETPSRWDAKLFAGVGGAYTFGFDQIPLSYSHRYSRNSQVMPALRAGLDVSVRVGKRWRVGAEVSHNLYADNFNGVKANMPLDQRTNVKLGVTLLLMKRHKEKPQGHIVKDHRLREVPELPLLLPIPEEKNRKLEGRAFLDFPVNETVIYPTYRRNPQELARIRATVDSALFDPTIEVTRISLHGYASPESPWDNNVRLSKGRAAELKKHLQAHFNVGKAVFDIQHTAEDWDNLKHFIEDGNRRHVKDDIWYESTSILETPETPEVVTRNREALLHAINLDIDPDAREDSLKLVDGGRPYQWLKQHVYPGLRHTDYIIEYVVKEYSVEEARKLIYTHPEALSQEEMYRVAESHGVGTDGWTDALLTAARYFPLDHKANLNAAVACVKAHRLADAKRYLQGAGASDEARYVALVVAAMEGRIYWEKTADGKIVEVPEEDKKK